MRATSLFAGAVVALAGKDSGKGEAPPTMQVEPLLTAGGVWNFASKSIYLTKDLSYFLGSSLVEVAWEYVPPNVQAPISEKYEEVSSALNTFRVKNGIPAPAQLLLDVQSEYSKKVHPHIETGLSAVYSTTGRLSKSEVLRSYIGKFEDAYPQHAGSISTDFVDLAALACFMMLFVMRYALSFFCYVFCCGCCAKRKAKADAPKLQKPVKVSSNKKHR